MPRAYWRFAVAALFLPLPSQTANALHICPTPAERLVVLQREFGAILKQFDVPESIQKDKDAHEKRLDQLRRDLLPSVQQALELAERHPKDPAAFDALAWIVTAPLNFRSEADSAFRILIDRHATSDKSGPAVVAAGSHADFSDIAWEFLKTTLAKSPHRVIRGIACYTLADRTLRLAEKSKSFRSSESGKEALFYQANGAGVLVKRAQAHEPETLTREAIALFKRVENEFGDIKNPDKGPATLGEMAKYKCLWHPGCSAPEIAGVDLDGAEMKLSSFRGKVVVVSFWSSTCVPCLKLVPDENKLVERMKERPFIMLGVNSDADPEAGSNAAAKAGMNWRSWWSDKKAPITDAWRVIELPSIWVIDHNGIVRQANDFKREDLHSVVEKLVVEAEKKPRQR